MKRLKELEKENARLRRGSPELTLGAGLWASIRSPTTLDRRVHNAYKSDVGQVGGARRCWILSNAFYGGTLDEWRLRFCSGNHPG